MAGIRFFILLFSVLSMLSLFISFFAKLRKKKRLIESFFNGSNKKDIVEDKIVNDLELIQIIKGVIKNSKANITIEKFLVYSLICGLLGGILGYIATEYIPMAVCTTAAACFIPYARLSGKARARKKEIELQFPQMLKHIGNYLRAGSNLRQAIEKTLLVTEGSLAEVLGDIIQRLNSGRTMSHAISDAYDEVPLIEFKMFDILICIHNDMGGDLTNSLENLASVIDEKKALRMEIDTLTQETRISAYLTAIIPSLLYLILRYVSPDYMKQIEALPLGKLGIVISFGFIMFGVFVVKKISAVKVDKAYK